MSDSVRPMQPDRKMKYSVIFSAQVLSLLLQVLRLMFIVGRHFDQCFPYENIEALARQSFSFLRLSVKLFFGSHRIPGPMSDEGVAGQTRFLRLVPSEPCRADLS